MTCDDPQRLTRCDNHLMKGIRTDGIQEVNGQSMGEDDWSRRQRRSRRIVGLPATAATTRTGRTLRLASAAANRITQHEDDLTGSVACERIVLGVALGRRAAEWYSQSLPNVNRCCTGSAGIAGCAARITDDDRSTADLARSFTNRTVGSLGGTHCEYRLLRFGQSPSRGSAVAILRHLTKLVSYASRAGAS